MSGKSKKIKGVLSNRAVGISPTGAYARDLSGPPLPISKEELEKLKQINPWGYFWRRDKTKRPLP